MHDFLTFRKRWYFGPLIQKPCTRTSYSIVQSVIWQMSYEILQFLLFISQDKMIRANKYFHNYISKLWWYKCVLRGVCCYTRKKFTQVAKKRQHFDLCNLRLMCQINAPIPTNQRRYYSLSSKDVDKIEKAVQW